MTEIKVGKYRHFKGGEYYVMGAATHATPCRQDDEELVIYIDKDKKIWARPKKEFLSTVTHEGQTIPRFTYIDAIVSTPSISKSGFVEWWENGARKYRERKDAED